MLKDSSSEPPRLVHIGSPLYHSFPSMGLSDGFDLPDAGLALKTNRFLTGQNYTMIWGFFQSADKLRPESFQMHFTPLSAVLSERDVQRSVVVDMPLYPYFSAHCVANEIVRNPKRSNVLSSRLCHLFGEKSADGEKLSELITQLDDIQQKAFFDVLDGIVDMPPDDNAIRGIFRDVYRSVTTLLHVMRPQMKRLYDEPMIVVPHGYGYDARMASGPD